MKRFLLLAAAGTLILSAADWPSFRGPNGSGVADTKNLPVEFGPDKAVVWKTGMSPGYSSPAIGGEHIFLTAQDGRKLHTLCLDRRTGRILWRREAPKELPENYKPAGKNSPAAPSPVTDGQNVYVFFEAVGLLAYGPDGDERWRMPLGPFNTPYGLGSSPILAGDTVLMLCDQDTGSFLLALDKDTGKVRWRTARPEVTHGFSTPIVYRPPQGPAQIIVSGSYQLAAYSVQSGEKIWWVDGLAWQAKSHPVIHGDTLYLHSWMANVGELGLPSKVDPWDQVLAEHDANHDGKLSKSESPDKTLTSLWFLFDLNRDGFLNKSEWETLEARNNGQNGLYAIRLGGKGDVTKTHVLWRYDKSLPNIPSPLYYKDVVYVLREGGIMTALNAKTGAVLKQGRIKGALDPYFASPVAADDKIYTVSDSCKVAVLRAGGEWEVITVNDLKDECWATPAIADERIYVRTQTALYCFGKQG